MSIKVFKADAVPARGAVLVVHGLNNRPEVMDALIDVLVRAGLPSKAEARRRITQGAVRVNGEKVSRDEVHRRIGTKDLEDFDGAKASIVRFGKGRVATVRLQDR